MKPASARSPRTSACTSRRRSGCSRALEERELVEQTQERGKYRLGFGILRLASAVPGQLDVTQQARPVCEQLAAQLGETVNIAVRRSHFVVNIDQARGPSAVAAHNWVGELTPLHATSSGKVLLAYMTPEERRERVGRARGLPDSPAHTITSQRRTRGAGRRRPRGDGYASSIEELEDGLNAVAAPVRDHTGGVIAALSRVGSGLPVHRRAAARGGPRCGRRRGGDQPPDGPPRLSRDWRGHFVSFACTQSWNSPMWCSLGTSTPPSR